MRCKAHTVPEKIHQHAMENEHGHDDCLPLQWRQGLEVVNSQPVQQAAQKPRAGSKGGLGNLSWPCRILQHLLTIQRIILEVVQNVSF